MWLRLHGITLQLTADYTPFLEYVNMAMRPFVTSAVDAPQVRSHLEWINGPPSASPSEAFGVERWDRRPDRDLYLVGSNAYWLRIDDFRDFQLAASWTGTLRLTGRYYFHLGGSGTAEALRRLRWAAKLDRLRAGRFSTILYYMVYHPIVWWLSRHRALHVLHGAGVCKDGRAALFGGMPGCGKSTLAVSLLSDPACMMLSDNMVLYDTDQVRACPELLLLDRASLAMVGTAAKRLQPAGDTRVFAREAFRPDVISMEGVTPGAFFAVERGAETRKRPLEATEGARRLLAGNTMAKEVRRLAIMSEVLDLVAELPVPDAKEDLLRLLSKAPTYALTIKEGVDLGELARRYVEPAFVDRREG